MKRTLNIYLGKEEDLKKNLQGRSSMKNELEDLETFSFGYVTALWKITELLSLTKIIDENTGKRKQGLSVGEYIRLAVINRIDEPCSKNSISNWITKTWFSKNFNNPETTLSGQAYWNHLEYLDEKTIEFIELGLNKQILKIFNLDLDCLMFDPTNFHTFIKTSKCGDLPKKKRAKSGRSDLKIVALSLLVTRKRGIPLMHKVYAGNMNDSKHFKNVIPEFVKRFKSLKQDIKEITMVFDKGNNSVDNINDLRDKKLYFVTSLRPSSFKHLATYPESNFKEITLENKKKILACEVIEEVYRLSNQRVIITKDKKSEKKSLLELLDRIAFISKEIVELKNKLNWKSWRSREHVEKKLKTILKRRAGKCFNVKVDGPDGNLTMTVELCGDEIEKKTQSYGRSYLTTNREDWKIIDVVSAYHDQYVVEDDFKKMKCVESINSNPIYHWTDQKIRAHLFICVIALLVKVILREHIAQQGSVFSHNEIKQHLERINYVQYKIHGGKIRGQLSSMSGIPKKLAILLGLPKLLKK